MSGFKFVNMADLKDEKYATHLFPYCSHKVIAMMKNAKYMLGIGLGKEGKVVVEFPNIKTQVTKEGLGFFEGCDRIKKNHGTLETINLGNDENPCLIKIGFPYCERRRRLPLLWLPRTLGR